MIVPVRCFSCNKVIGNKYEKWVLLNVMVGLLKTDYTNEDLSYVKLAPKVGYGGPGKVIYTEPPGSDSY